MSEITKHKGMPMNTTFRVTILHKYKKAMFSFFLLASLTTITACSGGSSSTASGVDNTGNSNILTGVFLDAPVGGLNYQTATMSGITDENGTFMYHDGETVAFKVGDLMLGSAPGSEIMTPIDLVPGAVDETDPTVTNICRLLQSLDWDGDLTNGIMITDTMRSEISGRMIDFNKDTSAFNDYDMQAFFDTMNTLGGFQYGEYRELMTPLEAQNNFKETLMNNMGYMHSVNPAWDPTQSGSGMNGMPQGASNSSM